MCKVTKKIDMYKRIDNFLSRKFNRLELRVYYDGNCGALIFLLIVSNLQWDVRIRDFLMLIFLDNNATKTA